MIVPTNIAVLSVENYVIQHLDKSDPAPEKFMSSGSAIFSEGGSVL